MAIPFSSPKPIEFRLGQLAWDVFVRRTVSARTVPKKGWLTFHERGTERWIATLGSVGFSERAEGSWVTIRRLRPADAARLKRHWVKLREFRRISPLERPSRDRGVVARVWPRYPEVAGGVHRG